MMSDLESDSASDSDASVDFEELLTSSHALLALQEDAIHRLHHLQQHASAPSLLETWDAFLTPLHAAALEDIRNTGRCSFGAHLRAHLIKKDDSLQSESPLLPSESTWLADDA